MTIELDEQSYIVGMWFSSCPKTENNWLACAIKDPENPKVFKVWSRFRYANGDKIFNSDDDKSWTTFRSAENLSEEDCIKLMEAIQNGIEEGYPDKDRIIVKGDLIKLMELSKDKDWMHIRSEKVDL